MKKNIIALAVAAAFAAPVAMADAPTVYGQINMNFNNNLTAETTTVGSTASRLGIKGSEDLGNGLKAVYKMEFGIDADGGVGKYTTGTSGISDRNAYVGLAGGFGTVLLGRHDTPAKMSQPTDLFNDGVADLGKLTNGVDTWEIRGSNVAAYVSPSFSGVKLMVASINEINFADAHSAAVTYGSTKKGLYLAAAITELNKTGGDAATRLSAQYKTGGLIANIMYNDSDNTGSLTHVQAGYKMGKFMPKIKIAMADADAAADEETAYSIGLNYSLGKKTTAYGYYTDAEDFTAGKTTNESFIVGMVHKF